MENGDITINVKLSMDKSSYDDTNTKINALLDEFERLAMPLFKFLKENYHPHAKIEISDSYIKVVEDTICISKNNGSKENRALLDELSTCCCKQH